MSIETWGAEIIYLLTGQSHGRCCLEVVMSLNNHLVSVMSVERLQCVGLGYGPYCVEFWRCRYLTKNLPLCRYIGHISLYTAVHTDVVVLVVHSLYTFGILYTSICVYIF